MSSENKYCPLHGYNPPCYQCMGCIDTMASKYSATTSQRHFCAITAIATKNEPFWKIRNEWCDE